MVNWIAMLFITSQPENHALKVASWHINECLKKTSLVELNIPNAFTIAFVIPVVACHERVLMLNPPNYG